MQKPYVSIFGDFCKKKKKKKSTNQLLRAVFKGRSLAALPLGKESKRTNVLFPRSHLSYVTVETIEVFKNRLDSEYVRCYLHSDTSQSCVLNIN